jgi:hypothetical protein
MPARQFFLPAACLLAMAAPRWLTAQTSRWLPPTDSLAQMITVREAEWAQVACTNSSVQEQLLASDFVGTSTDGTRYTKAQAVQGPTTRKDVVRDCELTTTPQVHLFGSALALVYGAESSVRTDASGKAAKRCQVWTDTWLKRDGEWQIIAAQDAVISCDAKTSVPGS